MADDPRVLDLVDQYLRRHELIKATYGLLNDPGRVGAAEHVAQVLSDETKATLDKICGEICEILNVPLAAVTLIDSEYQMIIGACGTSKQAMERGHSLCIFVAASGTDFDLSDLDVGEQELLCLPAYQKSNVRAYLGRPLVVHDETVGALCLVDYVPRAWTETEKMTLTAYAAHVSSVLEERT